jgi:hypothetical protein
MAQLSAALNLLGSLLVFASFQATSTKLLLVTGNGKEIAFCIGDRAVFGLSPDGRGMMMGYRCPTGDTAKPAAVVNTDAPWMAISGWMILAAGFGLQFFSIEKPKEIIIPKPSYGPRQKSPYKPK